MQWSTPVSRRIEYMPGAGYADPRISHEMMMHSARCVCVSHRSEDGAQPVDHLGPRGTGGRVDRVKG